MSAVTCTCNGDGSYGVHEPPEEPIPFGPNGATIQCMGGYSTHLCACRIDLPPREGDAAWWTEDTIDDGREWEDSTTLSSVTANITIERPVSNDNYRVFRRPENRMYPAFAHLDFDISTVGLMSCDLRGLADWLRELADEVDRVDAIEEGPAS